VTCKKLLHNLLNGVLEMGFNSFLDFLCVAQLPLQRKLRMRLLRVLHTMVKELLSAIGW